MLGQEAVMRSNSIILASVAMVVFLSACTTISASELPRSARYTGDALASAVQSNYWNNSGDLSVIARCFEEAGQSIGSCQP